MGHYYEKCITSMLPDRLHHFDRQSCRFITFIVIIERTVDVTDVMFGTVINGHFLQNTVCRV